MLKLRMFILLGIVAGIWGTVLADDVSDAHNDVGAIQELVREAYLRELGREADTGGLAHFTEMMQEEDRDAEWLSDALRNSEEGQRIIQARRQARRQTIVGFFAPHAHLTISLLLAIAVGLIISQVYKHTHRGMNFELSFMSTLVLLAPIVTLVMLYIRGDLVLSLGLIGSLSIIRFRTPIKDSRDMVFLFWTIAVGLGAGTYNWTVVIVSSLIMVPVVFVLYFVRYGRSNFADFVLVCVGSGTYPADQIQGILDADKHDVVVRSHEVDGDTWETVFELRGSGSGRHLIETLVSQLQSISCINKVSLLAPKLDLPV